MRNPKHTDPEMASFRQASRALERERLRLKREMDEALRPFDAAVRDAYEAVVEACDAPTGLVLDDAGCRWMRKDEQGQMALVEVNDAP